MHAELGYYIVPPGYHHCLTSVLKHVCPVVKFLKTYNKYVR
jgi:hypothetical protein